LKVNKIEISRLRYECYPDRFKADVCLYLGDDVDNEHENRLIHLDCRATEADQTNRAGIAAKLLRDARRQLTWMPQGADDTGPVVFPDNPGVVVID
jgi:hypothetical protein